MFFDRIDEFEMAKMIKLPDFLISMELFEIVEESQIKNFKYQEISKKIKTQDVFHMFNHDDLVRRKRQNMRGFSEYCCSGKMFLLQAGVITGAMFLIFYISKWTNEWITFSGTD